MLPVSRPVSNPVLQPALQAASLRDRVGAQALQDLAVLAAGGVRCARWGSSR